MNTTGRIRLKKTNQRINSELFGIILFVLSTAFALYLSFNLDQVPGIAQESKGISFLFVIYYIVFIVIFTAAALYMSFKSDATSYLFGGSVYFSSMSHFLPFTVSPTISSGSFDSRNFLYLYMSNHPPK